MIIAGIQKLTLLDFPGKIACTMFTPGCNFRCPFCHNAGLVKGDEGNLPLEDVFSWLETRKGKIDGVCITGGEPLLQKGIIPFMKKIKEMGFLVKLDTNGSYFGTLKQIVTEKLCDYVAMDVKNTPEKYAISAGVDVDIESVKKSVEFLKQGLVPWEFRTTVVKELNEKEDFKEIANWIKGANCCYYLQKFKDSGAILMPGYSPYSDEEMHEILDIVRNSGFESAYLRGIE